MWKFITQYPRGTPFECTYNLVRGYVRRGFDDQVNVVGLNGQSQDCPMMLLSYFVADFAEADSDSIYQHFLASFRYPDKVVAHPIDRMIGAFNVIRLHVDTLTYIDSTGKKNVRVHPQLRSRGFPAPESYNERRF